MFGSINFFNEKIAPSIGPTGKWALDGALATNYAIPENTDPSRVVRVTPFG